MSFVHKRYISNVYELTSVLCCYCRFHVVLAESSGAGVDLLAATLAGIGVTSTPTTTATASTQLHHTPSSPLAFRFVSMLLNYI
jgi:hypothetical protein